MNNTEQIALETKTKHPNIKTKQKNPKSKHSKNQNPPFFQYTPESSELHLSYRVSLPPQSQTNGLYLALQVVLSLHAV